MFVLRRASRGSVQLVVCLWLYAAVFFCTLLKSENLTSWGSFRSGSILQPSCRLSNLPRRFFELADEPRKQKNVKAKASPTNQAQSATAGGGSPKTAAIGLGGNTGTTKIGLGNARTLELMITGVAISDLDVDHKTGRIVIGLGEQAAKAEGPTTQAKAKPPPAKAKLPLAKAEPPPRQRPPPTAEELADIEDFEVGATLKGKVVGKNKAGVWVDIGKIYDAKVNLMTKIGEKLEWAEELDVTIVNIDKETARVTVSISEQEQAKIFAREVSKKSMTSFVVGETVGGYVSQASRRGIFVDVGAERNALLRRDPSITESIKNGDKLENLKVVEVNMTARTITLSVPEDS